MTLDPFTDLVYRSFTDHWIKVVVGLVITLGTSAVGWFLAWRAWRRRQDLGVIHFSQNTIERRPSGPQGEIQRWLILDVFSENPLEEDISHAVARRLIRQAAKRTTVNQPFLLFPAADRWYVLNLIRLAIAEQFRAGAAAKMAEGAKVVTVDCIFALTYERYATMRQGKIRVMIVKRSNLDDPAAFDEPLKLESPTTGIASRRCGVCSPTSPGAKPIGNIV